MGVYAFNMPILGDDIYISNGVCVRVCVCVCARARAHACYAQLCLTLCDPMDCSLSGSSVLGIPQDGILGWVTISYSRGSS